METHVNMRYFGLHLSIQRGFAAIAQIANKLGVTAVQIHPTTPHRWNTKPIPDAAAEVLAKHLKNSTLKFLVLHAIYLINLAHAENSKFHLSKVSLVNYMNFCHQINHFAKLYGVKDFTCAGTVVHPGSAKHYKTEDQAMQRVIKGINWVLEKAPHSTLLLEISAGAGQIIGDRFEELAILRNNAIDKDRVFYCLDTQHMWASGYDLTKPDKIVKEIDKILGIENVKLIHINNSEPKFNTRKDRHANLKTGTIPLKILQDFVNHPALKHIPVILETPACKDLDSAKKELQVLQKLLAGSLS